MTGKTVTAGRDMDEISDFDGTEPAAVSTDAASAPWLKPYRWRPGVSGNPGGRLSGLARRVREATRNGEDLIEFLYRVMNDPSERTRDRLAAAHELLNRGWGRPPAFLAIERFERHREKRVAMPRLEAMPIERQRQLLALLEEAMGGKPLALFNEAMGGRLGPEE